MAFAQERTLGDIFLQVDCLRLQSRGPANEVNAVVKTCCPSFISGACTYQQLVVIVVGSGFEPLKAKPADLQSAPIGHSGNPPFST